MLFEAAPATPRAFGRGYKSLYLQTILSMIFQPDHMVQNGGNLVCPEFGFKSVIDDHVRLPWIESLPPKQSGASAPKYALVRQGSCLPRQGIGRLSFDLSVVSLSSIARARKAEPTIRSVASPNKIIWIRWRTLFSRSPGPCRPLLSEPMTETPMSGHVHTVRSWVSCSRAAAGRPARSPIAPNRKPSPKAIQSSSAQKTPRPQTEASPKRGSRPASTP